MLEFTNNLPSVSHWPVRPVELDFRLHDGTPVVHIWYGAAKRKAQLRDHGDYTYVVTAGNKKTEYLIGINYASLVETLTECSAKTEGICVSMDCYSCRVAYRDFDQVRGKPRPSGRGGCQQAASCLAAQNHRSVAQPG